MMMRFPLRRALAVCASVALGAALCVPNGADAGAPAAAELDAAKAELAAAQQRELQASADLEAFESGKQAALRAMSAARQAVGESGERAAKAGVRAMELKGVYDKMSTSGSYAFFEYEQGTYGNAADALKAFKEAKYSSWTKVGTSGDATYLAYMDNALRFIDECNAIRKKNGLGELKVTHYLMAVAELNLNWSAKNIGHSKQFNVGENLAWGYGTETYDGNESVITTKNPFEGWYEAEKEISLNRDLDGNGKIGNGMTTDGHYKNVVNSTYATTGFAYSPDSSAYGDSVGQTFQVKTTGTAYTTAQYRTHLANYRAYLGKVKEAYDAAAGELASAQAELSAAQKALAESQAAYDAATPELKASKQAALDAAKAAVEEKQKAVDAAQAKAQAALESGQPAGRSVSKEDAARYSKLPKISKATMTGFKKSVAYTSGDMEQKIKLVYGSKKLVKGKDYRVSYQLNSGVGTAKMVVSGSEVGPNATFRGSFTKSFKIVPAGTSVSKLTAGAKSFTATWKTQKIQTSGYQLRYSTSKSMAKAKVKTLAKNNYASFSLKGAQAKKRYYVQIRTYKKVGKTKFYSAWSKKKSVKVK